ncbi:MAG: exodeoxyribonuclease VII large subunit, partial [Candidatus Omnitrophica bacterium]|nr:exodeoxyribonuclease VII large subunit [Candidatus Omnitrophota bacterium]
GLFDPDRKQPPPFHLRRVIVITSPTGAAIQDFLRVLRSRGTPVEILILPVRVQGVEAPMEIARAIGRARDLGGDLVLLTRGGGSLEDLWGFNEEVVARAIADCPIPLVSAVGHEVDYTISDFVADLRVPTPTAGAHLVADLVEGLYENFDEKKQRLGEAIGDVIQHRRVDLNLLIQRLKSKSPASQIPHFRQRIDDTLERCGRALVQRVASNRRDVKEILTRLQGSMEKDLLTMRSKLEVRKEKILAFNPQSTLSRGYSRIETAKSNRPIRKKNEVPTDEDIRVQLADGAFEATPHL